MSYYKVGRTRGLFGEIKIQGSKNAALPIIAAALLHKGQTIIRNCPNISDVRNMIKILEHLGCKCRFEHNILEIDSLNVTFDNIPKEDVSKLRSSVVLMGALLGRNGCCRISYPGGCNIGLRKIDVHVDILRKMGYQIDEDEEEVVCLGKVERDNRIRLRVRSVGATENGILASAISDNHVIILSNVAREPEIVNLCNALNEMGADIRGAGTDEIIIKGVDSLHDAIINIDGDRIVAGTYMAALTAVGGEINLMNINKDFDSAILRELEKFRMTYSFHENGMMIKRTLNTQKKEKDIIISTETYPGFPTDMQSQIMALMTVGEGTGIIVENIFENRFGTAIMLRKMGADINIIGERISLINGVERLMGTEVEATDLRGGAALIIAGMMAEGFTIIRNGEYIQRGYESIEKDLSNLGADVTLLNGGEDEKQKEIIYYDSNIGSSILNCSRCTVNAENQ